MFTASTPELTYADPWLLPLAERLRMLCRGRRRVAYYYEEPNNSTFRYRSYNMAQVLNADSSKETAPAHSASWFHRADLPALGERLAEEADLLVVCRSGYEHRLARLIAAFRRRGKRVLFDVDDLVFDTRYVHLILNTMDQDADQPEHWNYWFSYVGRMGATLDECDGAIATNAYLAERLAERCNKPVTVMPNFMNAEQLAASDAAWQAKLSSGFARDGCLTLGYFSGSPSHSLDYAVAEPAIAALMARRPELRLLTVGYIEPGAALAPFASRVSRAPFHDWVNLQRLLSRVEVNLMPLQPGRFTDCKSPLKYFEAAAVGTVSIASPSANYAPCIEQGVNGYLARGHEWERMIDSTADSIGRYPDLAGNARKHALQHFAWTTQRPALLHALGWD